MMTYQSTLSILDPTGLIGREITDRIADRFPELRRIFFHTGEDEEHLIADVAGEPCIVPRLEDLSELASCAAVIVTSPPREAVAEPLLRWLRSHPEVILVDATQPGIGGTDSATVLDDVPRRRGARKNRWFHLVDPSLSGAARVIAMLDQRGVTSASVCAIRPVTSFGTEALEELAAQGIARLSGGDPPRPEHLPAVLAFDVMPARPEIRGNLEDQLAQVLPEIPLAVEILDAGVFHGHAATITAHLVEPLPENGFRRLIRETAGVRMARRNEPVGPSAIVGGNEIVCSHFRASGTTVTCWIVADGLSALGPATADVLSAALAS